MNNRNTLTSISRYKRPVGLEYMTTELYNFIRHSNWTDFHFEKYNNNLDKKSLSVNINMDKNDLNNRITCLCIYTGNFSGHISNDEDDSIDEAQYICNSYIQNVLKSISTKSLSTINFSILNIQERYFSLNIFENHFYDINDDYRNTPIANATEYIVLGYNVDTYLTDEDY